MVAEKDEKKQITKLIFPRYHQLDATRKLQQVVLVEGAGEKYLIQHSAGSGKTNSIAWSAHFLADLHDANDKKVFDTVLVVSDRRLIDGQLQDAIRGFERTAAVKAIRSFRQEDPDCNANNWSRCDRWSNFASPVCMTCVYESPIDLRLR